MVTLTNILGSAELAQGFTAETFQFASEQPFGQPRSSLQAAFKGQVLLPGKSDGLGTLFYLNSQLWVCVCNVTVVLCMLHCLKVLE